MDRSVGEIETIRADEPKIALMLKNIRETAANLVDKAYAISGRLYSPSLARGIAPAKDTSCLLDEISGSLEDLQECQRELGSILDRIG